MNNGLYHSGVKAGIALFFSLLLIQCTSEQADIGQQIFRYSGVY